MLPFTVVCVLSTPQKTSMGASAAHNWISESCLRPWAPILNLTMSPKSCMQFPQEQCYTIPCYAHLTCSLNQIVPFNGLFFTKQIGKTKETSTPIRVWSSHRINVTVTSFHVSMNYNNHNKLDRFGFPAFRSAQIFPVKTIYPTMVLRRSSRDGRLFRVAVRVEWCRYLALTEGDVF